jgi:hypothetical protein
MTSTLKQVLNVFEDSQETLSLGQMAKRLDITPGMLDDMLAFWVRKGKLREVGGASLCRTCGVGDSCPFIAQMPRRYQLVTADTPEECTDPTCGCGV